MFYGPRAPGEQIPGGVCPCDTLHLLAVEEGGPRSPRLVGEEGVRGQDQDTKESPVAGSSLPRTRLPSNPIHVSSWKKRRWGCRPGP